MSRLELFKNMTNNQIADQLDVQYLLQPSICKNDDKIRILIWKYNLILGILCFKKLWYSQKFLNILCTLFWKLDDI